VVRDFATELAASTDKDAELSSVLLGGRGLTQSNKHYGVPTNMLRKNRGVDMGDGWETARYLDRPPIIKTDPTTGLVDSTSNDWCVLRMACVVTDITKLALETTHFKGNFPESARVDYCCVPEGKLNVSDAASVDQIPWKPFLKRTKLAADATFVYEKGDLEEHGDVTHLRLFMYPDGGVSRVRLFGKAKAPILDDDEPAARL
jgi:allantoicase